VCHQSPSLLKAVCQTIGHQSPSLAEELCVKRFVIMITGLTPRTHAVRPSEEGMIDDLT